MAFLASSSNGNLVLSLKLALISTGVLSVAVILKLSAPSVTYFAVSALPVMYSSALSWLQPPYLYLVINGIIISILASSKLQLQKSSEPLIKQPPEIIFPPATVTPAAKSSSDIVSLDYSNDAVVGEYLYQEDCTESKDLEIVSDGGDEAVIKSKTVQRTDSMELLFEKFDEFEKEKPLLSARFSQKRSKSSPEAGKATLLGVSKSKRRDTLESTWKMITDGRAMPLTRHLKKSDTWDSHLHRHDETSSPLPLQRTDKMKKSETFSENQSKLSTQNRQGSGKLKKEPSLSQDELNRRVEAFIKKFNEEMRLQRQESLNHFQEMINRGAY